MDDVCEVAKSKVQYDSRLGPRTRNKLGYGLIASRAIKVGEKFYSIVESGYDFKIVPRKKNHGYNVFKWTNDDVLEAVHKEQPSMYAPDKKPLIYFLQHHDPGNVKVRTPNLHLTYT